MTKLRVLIVDDSVVMRKTVRDLISADPELEVAGAAANGKIALAMVDQCSPDVVIMDIEMPEMDGLTAVKEIRLLHRTLPIVMFSSVTERGASETLDALAFGANDYVTKPSNAQSLAEGTACIRDQLVPKIKALCRRTAPPPVEGPRTRITLPSKPLERDSRIDVIAIGTSTGGPNALGEIMPRFPKDFPVPILIVQHMPPVFTAFLAERLSASAQIPIKEGLRGAELEPGNAWIAPGDFHMTISREGNRVRLGMNQLPPENSCRPSVDVMFRSVAEVYGPGVLAIMLTGMGQDGLRGCERIREAGGQIVVQDEESSVVWGMPGAVANAGIADQILSLARIPDVILQKVIAKGRRNQPAASPTEGQAV